MTNKKRPLSQTFSCGVALASLLCLFTADCDRSACRQAIGLAQLPPEGFFRRCLFGKDYLNESRSHQVPLYPACDFYVNTEPLLFVKSGTEGIILDQRFNSRLNKNVFQVRVIETGHEGWALTTDLCLLTTLYNNRELNAQESKLICRLKVTKLSTAFYKWELLFINEDTEVRELFFSPLLNTSTQSPPLEVRNQVTGDLINFDLDLKGLTTDDYLYIAGKYLYKKIKPQRDWLLVFYLHLKENEDREANSVHGYVGLINYLCRPEGNPMQYWVCASALTHFD